MPTYLVLKRVKEDWVSLPGELLVDPPSADILMARGFIVPVPDNYPGAVSGPSQPEAPIVFAAPEESPLVDSPTLVEPGDSEESNDSDDLLDLEEEAEATVVEPTYKARPVARAARPARRR
jgi:hypothetical protein